tara:strand:- start:52401 stop:53222 length:822 start_codon:yes stop_codon:yes gene_type:complete
MFTKLLTLNDNFFHSVKLLSLGSLLVSASIANAGNGANFILYNHHTAERGEKEIMLMNDFGQEADGSRYTAQMIEIEYGITDRWTTELMFEGQKSSGGSYEFTGFRLENRFRLFDYGTFLNPVFYTEYEDLGEDTKYLMEVAGREDAEEHAKARPRERVMETRIIIGEDITEQLDISMNWINESDLDTGVTAFGYAAGLNYAHEPGVTLGLEFFGGLGDSDKGIATRTKITQHYLGPNIMYKASDKVMVKIGGAIGLTDVSQDLFRFAIAYDL